MIYSELSEQIERDGEEEVINVELGGAYEYRIQFYDKEFGSLSDSVKDYKSNLAGFIITRKLK